MRYICMVPSIVDKWNVYMDDVLELEMDPVTGAQPKMQCMFLME